MDIRKSYDLFKPEECRERIHIIGCGAVGSTIAENLVRYGLTNITLYDFDKVASHNVANQMYTEYDVGKLKVEALAAYLRKINPYLEENTFILKPEGYTNQRLNGYVFLCVDNIDLRRKICYDNIGNNNIRAVFDCRMRAVDAQSYAADWLKPDSVRNLLNSMDFTHEEALKSTPVSACNMTLSVNTTIRLISAYCVANFVNFVKTGKLKKMILVDTFNFGLEAY